MLSDHQQPSNEYKFSIIIPVLYEQEQINEHIEQIVKQQSSKSYEIIVVDGDFKGGTIDAVNHSNVVKAVSEKGRAKQMNKGASIAKGEILLFLHADTILPDNALEIMTETLENEKYVGGAFDLGIDSDRLSLKLIAARARLRCRLSRIPYGDQAIFMRKQYFEKIGRFKEIPFLEDVELMQRVKKNGDKICILPQRVKTSARRWEKEGVLYTTLRNMFVVMLHRFGVSPNRLTKYYKIKP